MFSSSLLWFVSALPEDLVSSVINRLSDHDISIKRLITDDDYHVLIVLVIYAYEDNNYSTIEKKTLIF